MRYFVTLGGRAVEVSLDGTTVQVGGESFGVDWQRAEVPHRGSLVLDGRSYAVVGLPDESGRWNLHVEGVRFDAKVLDERAQLLEEVGARGVKHDGPWTLRSPMPGLVVEVEVSEGEVVQQGQGLIIVEAMKMENELKAPASGRVGAIHVQKGDTIERNVVLLEGDPTEDPDPIEE